MPRLVAVDELTRDQHTWWIDVYGHQGENSIFYDNGVAISGVESVDPPIPSSGLELGRSIHAPLHPRYSYHSDPVSLYDSSFHPPPGPDNRSTIFRGRGGGRPISRSEYHHANSSGYYPYYQPPPLLPRQFPSPPTNDDEQRQDSCIPESTLRKRDRSIDSSPMDFNDDRYDNYYYRSTYLPPPPSIMSTSQRYFEPEASNEHMNRPSNTNEKSSTLAWNVSSPTMAAVDPGSETKQKKSIPMYPHLAEKLTWQQSFENLLVYKKTYGVSTHYFRILKLLLLYFELNRFHLG